MWVELNFKKSDLYFNEYMPYREQLVSDVVNRAGTAMTQEHCFNTAELALIAQKMAFKINGRS